MSEPLTPEREAEIRARAEAATEGPWWSDDSDACWRLHGVMFRHHGQVMNKQILKAPKHGTPYAEYWPEPADAEFIAHAREDVPALLAELDQVCAERDALEERLHRAAMARTWRNEDGKKFVFVEDIVGPLLGLDAAGRAE